jgi:hypothetical protein
MGIRKAAFLSLFISSFFLLVYSVLSDACNDLHEELGGYETVAVLHPIQVVDDNLLKLLECLPEGSETGDCILM